MIRKRLHLQIYFTIVASLIAVVAVSALTWSLFDRDQKDQDLFDITEQIIFTALPPATAPLNEQQKIVSKFGEALDVDISLYSADNRLLAAHGPKLARPEDDERFDSWHRDHGNRHGKVFALTLPDDRLLLVNVQRRWSKKPIFGLLLFLASAALAIGLAAYPFSRKLTGRLERLQHGVEQVGTGDLSARVKIEGKDEVARLATSFNDAAEKIENLLNAHKLLLANASHELRTPLARIRLGLTMLEDQDDPKRRAALMDDVAELDVLIDEILLTSRLDSGAQVDLMGTVDAMGLVAEECARYDNCELTGEAPEIAGDPRLLPRMVRNLIDNAYKHGRQPVSVHLVSDEAFVELTVSDSGSGIDESDYEQVFQPFFRGRGKQNTKGYGLGLPLVKQIAEAHGGSVEILPKAVARSAISVRLPI